MQKYEKETFKIMQGNKKYLQNITNHAQTPHICVETDLIKVDDFRRRKFWSSEHHL